MLRSARVLDTPSEKHYDSIAELAAMQCGAPLAAITFIDADRQWLKASVGTDVRETGLAQSLCVRTLTGETSLVVRDLAQDPQLCNHPAASLLRAYAAASIVVRGQRLGTCCVCDYRPREWTPQQMRALSLLAEQVSALIEARLVNASLHDAEAQLRGSLDTQEEMLGRLDTDLRITFANNALCRALGTPREELLGRCVLDFAPPAEHERIRTHFEETRTARTPRTLEQTIVDTQGISRTHRWTDSPLFNSDGSCMGYQSWGWDMTDAHERERQLREATRGLMEMNAALRARNAEVLQLTFAMTHDLQTPLATLTGQLSLLHTAVTTGQPAERPLQRARASVDRLTRMLTDLMAYARAGNEDPRRERVDVAELASAVVDELAPQAAEQGVMLCLAQSPARAASRGHAVLAEGQAMRRCLTNIIANAVKFTAQRSGGLKRVSVGLELDGAVLRCVVQDTGPGIPPTMLDAVFLPFKRVSTDASGTGLGLSIVKRYVEMFGGRVWLESDGSSGTRATMEFPRLESQAMAA
jgi:PAS domain S-box-containing protein